MNKKSILIIDDDKDFVHALAQRCQHIGLEVRKAHNAFSALHKMDRELPDLVCLDVNMPTGCGLTICEMMSDDENACRVPVIILTGKQDIDTVRHCRKLCAYYVHKSPGMWNRLEPVIYELVDIERPEPSKSCHESGQLRLDGK